MYSRSSRIASSGGEMSRLRRYGVVDCASLGVIVYCACAQLVCRTWRTRGTGGGLDRRVLFGSWRRSEDGASRTISLYSPVLFYLCVHIFYQINIDLETVTKNGVVDRINTQKILIRWYSKLVNGFSFEFQHRCD